MSATENDRLCTAIGYVFMGLATVLCLLRPHNINSFYDYDPFGYWCGWCGGVAVGLFAGSLIHTRNSGKGKGEE